MKKNKIISKLNLIFWNTAIFIAIGLLTYAFFTNTGIYNDFKDSINTHESSTYCDTLKAK